MERLVTCKICGFRAAILGKHLKTHGLTSAEYRKKYNAATASEEWLERNRQRALKDNPMHKDTEAVRNLKANSSMKNPETARKNAESRAGVKRTKEQRARISKGRMGKGKGKRNAMKRPEVRAKISGKNCHLWGRSTHHGRGGRVPVKRFDYASPIAGKITVIGTYELRMCKILDKLGWPWSYEPDAFPYVKVNGKDATYTPDFRVEWGNEQTVYVETKGYFPEEDQHKVNEVRKQGVTILVVGRKELKRLEDSIQK